MIPVLSREQMRAFDAHAIDVCKVPSLVLMENAGRGAAEVVERELLGRRAEGKRVVVLCGTGNNGGDAFVVARHLLGRGARVDAWLAGDPARMTPDCRANHAAFSGIGGHVEVVPLGQSLVALRDLVGAADVVVDGLFGTGLDRPVVEPLASVVETLNASAKVVALDVPSGMDADTGISMGATVRAKHTVTFAHLKLGHVTGHGARISGQVHVVDIGVPPTLRLDQAAAVVERKDVRRWLMPRPLDAHKYRVGHVAILAGSAGKVGASLLAAHGALRGGAGAATIVTWPDAAASLEARVLEVMTARIEEGDRLIEQIDAALVNKRAVVMGPGFGTGDRAGAAVRHVLVSYTGPIVADADALTIHAGALEDFRAASGRAILTPHAGELGRLLGTSAEEVESDRFAAAREAAARAHAVVVLKGPYSVVAAPDGRVAVNATGNPALATAGAGDVLAGLAGALACAMPPFEAAFAAAHLHGAAADAWAARHADRGLLAGEIADELPAAIAATLAG
jgi:hydroxyethylthiazole kinase-like uncharacterized protein yjeF